jgi:hypothetical protein
MWTSSAGENALQGHDTPDGLAKSLGLSCVRGASLEGRSVTIRRWQPAIPATGMQPEDHRNALDMKGLQNEAMAMRQAQTGRISLKRRSGHWHRPGTRDSESRTG